MEEEEEVSRISKNIKTANKGAAKLKTELDKLNETRINGRSFMAEKSQLFDRFNEGEFDREQLGKSFESLLEKYGVDSDWSNLIYDHITRIGKDANAIAQLVDNDFDGYIEKLQKSVAMADRDINPFLTTYDSIHASINDYAEKFADKYSVRTPIEITRVCVGEVNCDWCLEREYSGSYADLPPELAGHGGIFATHSGCDCEIEITPPEN